MALNKRPAKRRSKAKPAPVVLKTIGALAKHYGVRQNTIAHHWLADPSFPGKPAKPGGRDGRFELDAIDMWLIDREQSRTSGARSSAAVKAAERQGVELADPVSAKSRKAEVDLQLSQLKLQQKRGQLIDRTIVRAEILRQHAILQQTVLQIPHMFREVLPVDLDQEIKADFVRRAEIQVQKACDSFREGLEGI